jgi:peptidoglycan/LPS O-acetylase OafA/YrhL
MAAETRGGERIGYIDGLRAVAVLLVVAHHAMLHSPLLPHPIPFASLAHLMLEGAHGVDLFFVLSGFCLSYPVLFRLRRTGEATLDVPRYFAKRVVRIVPPYYAAIAVLLVLSGGSVNAVDILKQMLFFDWHTNFLNGSFWTLCVEFRWYFLFPIALALWIRASKVFVAAACISVLAYAFTRLHAPDIGTLLPFMLGIVAADIDVRQVRLDPVVWLCAPVCVLLGFVLEQSASMPAPYGGESPIFFVQTNAGWQLAAFLLVLGGARNGALRRALSFKPLVAIGTASYSIYLVHEPVVSLVQQHLAVAPGVRMPAAYAIAVVTGVVFWALFERVWMSGSVKEQAVAAVEPRVRAIARFLDLSGDVCFAEERRPAPDLG